MLLHVSLHFRKHVKQRSSRDEGISYHCCKKTTKESLSPDCVSTLQLQNRAQGALFKDKCTPCRQTEAEKVPNPQPLITSQWRTRAPLKDAGLTEWTCPSLCYLPIQWTQELRLCPEGSKGKGGVRYFSSWMVHYCEQCHYCVSFFDILFFNIPFFSLHESWKINPSEGRSKLLHHPRNTLEMFRNTTDNLKTDFCSPRSKTSCVSVPGRI